MLENEKQTEREPGFLDRVKDFPDKVLDRINGFLAKVEDVVFTVPAVIIIAIAGAYFIVPETHAWVTDHHGPWMTAEERWLDSRADQA